MIWQAASEPRFVDVNRLPNNGMCRPRFRLTRPIVAQSWRDALEVEKDARPFIKLGTATTDLNVQHYEVHNYFMPHDILWYGLNVDWVYDSDTNLVKKQTAHGSDTLCNAPGLPLALDTREIALDWTMVLRYDVELPKWSMWPSTPEASMEYLDGIHEDLSDEEQESLNMKIFWGLYHFITTLPNLETVHISVSSLGEHQEIYVNTDAKEKLPRG